MREIYSTPRTGEQLWETIAHSAKAIIGLQWMGLPRADIVEMMAKSFACPREGEKPETAEARMEECRAEMSEYVDRIDQCDHPPVMTWKERPRHAVELRGGISYWCPVHKATISFSPCPQCLFSGESESDWLRKDVDKALSAVSFVGTTVHVGGGNWRATSGNHRWTVKTYAKSTRLLKIFTATNNHHLVTRWVNGTAGNEDLRDILIALSAHGMTPRSHTDAKPGTLRKVRVMAERASRGECLFHSKDGTNEPPET